MICPSCGCNEGTYGEVWDDYLDADGFEHQYLSQWLDCAKCNERVLDWDDNFEYPEEW